MPKVNKKRDHSKQLGVMNNQTEYRTMTSKGSNKSVAEIKALMAEEIFCAPIVHTMSQEFLEAAMAKAIGAQKGERVEGRLTYRSGCYARRLRPGADHMRTWKRKQGPISIVTRSSGEAQLGVTEIDPRNTSGDEPGGKTSTLVIAGSESSNPALTTTVTVHIPGEV